jgi:chemotaxis protein methyltransferase CheR
MILQEQEFEMLRDLIYEETGIMFDARKLPFVETRVAKRLPAVDCKNPREYYRHLHYHDPKRVEFQAFIESLTTNETYFFREFSLLESFANEVLPRVTDEKRRARDYTLNVWSAGCSTGDEPYTLAIILRSCLDDFDRWHIGLHATDIDSQVLAVAQSGVYTERAMKDVPPRYLRQYFRQRGSEYFVNDEIKDMVKFSQVNLVDRRAMRQFRGMDFIFCRNVLIYFDDASRRQVLSSLYDSLLPGGFVFLGHSESVGRISAAFEPVILANNLMYRRPIPRPSLAVR